MRNVDLFSCTHQFFCSIYNLNSIDRTVARQMNFNHRIVKVQTQNKSAGFGNVCVSIVLWNILAF